MKLTNLQCLAIVFLLGAFLYFFEVFYHGFVHGDFNKVQIVLTFVTLLLVSGFLFLHDVIDKKIRRWEFRGFSLFFVVSVMFLFLIFFTRNMGPGIPLFFAGVYFAAALALNLKPVQKAVLKKVNLRSPMIRFSLRFFIILGLVILPAATYEYYSSGRIDFKFHSIALPLIKMITPAVQFFLSLSGFSTDAIASEGGTTLVLADGSYRVFVGILCSGVVSLSVFIAAFLALAWDLKTTFVKKAAMLIVGVLGTILSNVFRISTLFAVGYYFGGEAMIFMHTHLGWILYFIWITIFWVLAFRIAGERTKGKSKGKQ